MNRLTKCIAGISLGLPVSSITLADSGNSCYAIHDRDLRAQCLAMSRNQPSYCTQIRAGDARENCRNMAKLKSDARHQLEYKTKGR